MKKIVISSRQKIPGRGHSNKNTANTGFMSESKILFWLSVPHIINWTEIKRLVG